MFRKWFARQARLAELEGTLRIQDRQIEVLRGDVERLTEERNYLLDAVLRANGAAPIYSTDGVKTGVKEQEVQPPSGHKQIRNMRDWQSSLQELESLESKAFS